jgi:uncharacterized OsmC-like protein
MKVINETLHPIKVTVIAQDDSHALAKAREHQIVLNIQKGNSEAGFTAAETLMAALGTCMLTNIQTLRQKMQLQIDDVRIEFGALRKDVPPEVNEINYRLILTSSEPEEKLQEMHDLILKWGTVTNTLIKGIKPQGQLVITRNKEIEK